jgi:hypothetical protein
MSYCTQQGTSTMAAKSQMMDYCCIMLLLQDYLQ